MENVLCFDGARERGCDDREEIGLGGSLGGHGIFLLLGRRPLRMAWCLDIMMEDGCACGSFYVMVLRDHGFAWFESVTHLLPVKAWR